MRYYKIEPRNSTVCGQPGRNFDWTQFCWDGSETWIDRCNGKIYPAPLPFKDNFLIAPNCEYLHVPYGYAEQGTIYRVRPNDSMRAGRVYRGRPIEKQQAVKKRDGWYWRLKGG